VLSASPSAGVRLNGASCGATLAGTDSIAVTGGALADVLTLANDFAPGATAEDGSSEIEINLDLGGGGDFVTVAPDVGDDVLIFTGTGIDVFGDGDEDIALGGASVRALGGPGNDVIDASAHPVRISLHGDSEDDVLIGGPGRDELHGEAGNDIIEGGPENDLMFGGEGDDVEDGGDGNDRFRQESVANGGDQFIGGAGGDWVIYETRSIGVTVTLDDGLANDGAPGEGDNFGVDVEHVIGGFGNDVLIGSDVPNSLRGREGDDFLQGKGGRDLLGCSDGFDEGIGGPDTVTDTLNNCEIESD
jgi:Ca2+-binding RTX toxin-like protein